MNEEKVTEGVFKTGEPHDIIKTIWDSRITSTNIVICGFEKCGERKIEPCAQPIPVYKLLCHDDNNQPLHILTIHKYIDDLRTRMEKANSPIRCQIIKVGDGPGTRYKLGPPQ